MNFFGIFFILLMMKFKTMKEQEILIEFAKKHIEISTEDEEKIKKYFKVRNVEKNEILLNAGEVCNHLYFVVQGILRTFHLNANGTEFTRLIRKENQFCTVLLSFLNLYIKDSATTSNIFCNELTPANTTAINKIIAKALPNGMDFKIVQ